MLYHNPQSGQTLSHFELCRQENASVAQGLTYGQWLPVKQDAYPENPEEGAVYDLGPVVVRDGQAFQPWVKIEGVTQPGLPG